MKDREIRRDRPLPEEAEPTVPVLRPRLPGVERLTPYLRRIDASRIYSNYGPLARELEGRLSRHLGLPAGGVVGASSGTVALVGAILAMAGRPTDKRPLALFPAFTFVATAVAVELCGYRGYLADVDSRTWMLDPERLQSHPELSRIGVVVPVAPFGRPVPQEPWLRFREKTGIPIVIDGAASLECVAREPGRFLGQIPVAMSFHATKSYSTGEGGGVVSTSSDQAQRITQALNFGFHGSRDCALASTNGKMSEYHAAVGLAELDGWTEKQRSLLAVADAYRSRLEPSGLRERFFAAPGISSSYAVFRCRDADESGRVRESLRRHGVDSRLWYGTGVQDQTHFSDLPREDLSVTEGLAPLLLGLPVAPDLDDRALERITRGLVEGVNASS
ncbi:MAG: DegT/DnrJ/EryC1/StrS family aminotransferase [Thermoanaerobaculia bacterium]